MKIAVDIASGDNSPEVLLEGVIDALQKENGFEVIVIGNEKTIKQYIQKHSKIHHRIKIHHCTEIIGMNEKPAQACKKKPFSSVMIASKLVAESKADGFFSPGNTGATMIASFLNIQCIQGISRPVIATGFFGLDIECLVLDCGANIEMQAEQFIELAIIGQAYGEVLFKKENLKIGLLNIGSEENKGSKVYQNAFTLLKKLDMNFIGNIEPYDFLNGKADIILCDGFVGNITLKLVESFFPVFERVVKSKNHPQGKEFFDSLREYTKILTPVHYGGAPLLGLNGYVMVGHGNSGKVATKNAIFAIKNMIQSNVQKKIKDTIHSLQ